MVYEEKSYNDVSMCALKFNSYSRVDEVEKTDLSTEYYLESNSWSSISVCDEELW